MQSVVKHVLTTLRDGDVQIVELFMSFFSILWGVWFCINQDIFWRGFFDPTKDIQRVPGTLLRHEWVWGVIFLFFGITRLVSRPLNLPLRKQAAFVGIVLWLFMTSAMLRGNSSLPGIPAMIGIVVMATWIYVRTPRRSKTSGPSNG